MLRDHATALFRSHNPYPGLALENHNQRIGLFALALARNSGLAADEDVLWAGCALHDYGLMVNSHITGLPELDLEPLYLRRSWLAIQPHLPRWGLTLEQSNQLRDILLYNHGILPQRGIHPLAEVVRRAIQVEHSLGMVRHGLKWSFCRGIFRDYPRLNLNDILLDFARITFFEDGPDQLFPMFFPGRRIARS